MPTVSVTVEREVIEADVEIEIYCGTCGAGLCNQSSASRTRTRRASAIDVEVCSKCAEKAKDEGYKEGYADAEKEFNKD